MLQRFESVISRRYYDFNRSTCFSFRGQRGNVVIRYSVCNFGGHITLLSSHLANVNYVQYLYGHERDVKRESYFVKKCNTLNYNFISIRK